MGKSEDWTIGGQLLATRSIKNLIAKPVGCWQSQNKVKQMNLCPRNKI